MTAARTPERGDSASSARRPRVLVVAGHDPSGAGVDADRAALADLALDVASVVTARTDQDAHGVRSIGAREPSVWLAEARACLAGVDALKFGLLPGPDHVEAACDLVRAARAESPRVMVVVDPVLAASSGGRFLDGRGVDALRTRLFALDVIATPNVPELAELARADARELASSIERRVAAGRTLLASGLLAVVMKGGHGDEDPVHDVWITRDDETPVHRLHPRIVGGKVRGSGCRFASRLAGELASGRTLDHAVRAAAEHVTSAIERAARR